LEKRLTWGRDLSKITWFFEVLGLYLKKKIFDGPTLWELYSQPVEYIWQGFGPLIAHMRKKDASAYTNFEYLYDRLAEHGRKVGSPCIRHTEDQIRRYFATQSALLAPADQPVDPRLVSVPAVYPSPAETPSPTSAETRSSKAHSGK
jgi:hypothetical protein